MSLGRVVKAAVGSVLPGMLLLRSRGGAGVALTFDDGPHPHNTPRILECLARAGAKATFFLQGAEVEKHPALVREIAAGGHQVANHGWSHSRPVSIGTGAYVAEVLRTQQLLEDLTGAPVKRDFRPPYGAVNARVFAALAGRGFRFVFWSIDSDDSTFTEVPDLVARVAAQQPNHGDIVLFHEDYAHTADALPSILQGLQARQLVTTAVAAMS